MNSEEDERHPEDTPRVLTKTRVIRRGEPVRPTDPLQGSLGEIERRFLALQSVGPSADVLADYLTILAELRAIDETIQEMASRRDIPYAVNRQLSSLNDHCRWLVRRVNAELLLVLQVHLEQELKRNISPEAYQTFLRLGDIDDAAREVETLSDGELMARLRDSTLVREAREQVRLSDLQIQTAATDQSPDQAS